MNNVGVKGNLTQHGNDYILLSPNGQIRAVYNHWGLGMKGMLQRKDSKGFWKTVKYCQDEPQLMTEYYKMIEEGSDHKVLQSIKFD